jgi:hypothetical protein
MPSREAKMSKRDEDLLNRLAFITGQLVESDEVEEEADWEEPAVEEVAETRPPPELPVAQGAALVKRKVRTPEWLNEARRRTARVKVAEGRVEPSKEAKKRIKEISKNILEDAKMEISLKLVQEAAKEMKEARRLGPVVGIPPFYLAIEYMGEAIQLIAETGKVRVAAYYKLDLAEWIVGFTKKRNLLSRALDLLESVREEFDPTADANAITKVNTLKDFTRSTLATL